MKTPKYLTLLIVILSLLVVPFTAFAQDGDSFTSSGGVIFTLPEGWASTDFAGFTILSNSEDGLFAESMSEDSIQVVIFAGPAITDIVPEGTSGLDEVEAVLSEDIASSGVEVSSERTTINGNDAIIYEGVEDGQFSKIWVIAFEDGLVLMTATTLEGAFSNFEADFELILSTMEYDSSLATDGGDFNFGPSGPAEPIPVMVESGEGVLKQRLSLPVSEDFSGPSGLQYISISESGRIWLSDGFDIYELVEGEVVQPFTPEDFLFTFDMLATDEGIFVADSGAVVLVNFDGSFAWRVESSDDNPIFGDFGPTNLKMGPDGNLYTFNTAYNDDGSTTDTMTIISSAGDVLNSFEVNLPGDYEGYGNLADFTFGSDGNLLMNASDGSLFVYDLNGIYMTDGPVLESDALFYVDNLSTLPSGEFLVNGSGVFYLFSEGGEQLATFGAEAGFDNDEFAPGSFSYFADFDTLNGEVVVVDSSNTMSYISFLDFSAAE